MDNIKERLRNLTSNDFEDRVNLHIHSDFSDGLLSVKDIIKRCESKGLKLISITDHNTTKAYDSNRFLLSLDFVIPGIEFDCIYKGVLIHILGYGIDIFNDDILKLCAKDKNGSTYDLVRLTALRSPKVVIEAIHRSGGVAILAHPCCAWCFNIERYVHSLVNLGLDGLEVFYPYQRHRKIIKFHLKSSIENIANKYDLIKTGGTDCHGIDL